MNCITVMSGVHLYELCDLHATKINRHDTDVDICSSASIYWVNCITVMSGVHLYELCDLHATKINRHDTDVDTDVDICSWNAMFTRSCV
ncbi:hypothetical protein J6590_047608 [Homalodisca vitripennis]|nr:hypothetical protein J6590_047608 [Homalodisca vitripennis]